MDAFNQFQIYSIRALNKWMNEWSPNYETFVSILSDVANIGRRSQVSKEGSTNCLKAGRSQSRKDCLWKSFAGMREAHALRWSGLIDGESRSFGKCGRAQTFSLWQSAIVCSMRASWKHRSWKEMIILRVTIRSLLPVSLSPSEFILKCWQWRDAEPLTHLIQTSQRSQIWLDFNKRRI